VVEIHRTCQLTYLGWTDWPAIALSALEIRSALALYPISRKRRCGMARDLRIMGHAAAEYLAEKAKTQ
jgi:hypothetical protein